MTTTTQEMIRLDVALRQALDDREYEAVKHIADSLCNKLDYLSWEVAEFLYRHDVIPQDRIDVMNAEHGDYVYFLCDYGVGAITVPEHAGARIRDELGPDCKWIEEGCHMVDVKVDGKYYEIEVPYDVLAMQ